jgi:hypothetical protein
MNSRHPTRRFTHPTLDQREPSAAAVVASLGWLRARDAAGDTAGHTAGDAEVEGSALRDSVPAPVASHALGHALTHAPSRARVARLLATGNGVSGVSTVHPPLHRASRTAVIAAFVALATALFFAPTKIFSLHDRSSSGSLPTARRPSGVIKSPSEDTSERGTTGDSATRGAPRSNTLHFMTQGANEMHRNQFLAAIAGVGVVAAGAAAQDAVQWRVEDGGNGHWYLRIPRNGLNWVDCRPIAANMGGYLATMTSSAETNFLVGNVLNGEPAVIGGIQNTAAPNFTEPGGGWEWITGEAWAYENWHPCCGDRPEPNNWSIYGAENWLTTYADGTWNDGPYNVWWTTTMLIEWSADCNSDGIVDYGQIRSGELEDVNANGVPDCCDAGVACTCPADIDGNNEVNGIDLAIILDKWGTNGGKDYPNADIDRDGTINGADLAQVLGSWGPCQ